MSPHVSEGDVVGDIVGFVVSGVLSVGLTVVGLFRIIGYKKVVIGLLISLSFSLNHIWAQNWL